MQRLIFAIIFEIIQTISSDDFYIGAVVEYEPLDSEELPAPLEVMTYNADKYSEFIFWQEPGMLISLCFLSMG